MGGYEHADAAENTGSEQEARENIVAVQTGIHRGNDQQDESGKAKQHTKQAVEIVIPLGLGRDGKIVPDGLLRHLQYPVSPSGHDAIIIAQMSRVRKRTCEDLGFDDLYGAGNDLVTLTAWQVRENGIKFPFDGSFECFGR